MDGQGKLDELIEAVRGNYNRTNNIIFNIILCLLGIRSMVKMVDSMPDKNQQKILDKKLDKCRNPENNPDTEM